MAHSKQGTLADAHNNPLGFKEGFAAVCVCLWWWMTHMGCNGESMESTECVSNGIKCWCVCMQKSGGVKSEKRGQERRVRRWKKKGKRRQIRTTRRFGIQTRTHQCFHLGWISNHCMHHDCAHCGMMCSPQRQHHHVHCVCWRSVTEFLWNCADSNRRRPMVDRATFARPHDRGGLNCPLVKHIADCRKGGFVDTCTAWNRRLLLCIDEASEMRLVPMPLPSLQELIIVVRWHIVLMFHDSFGKEIYFNDEKKAFAASGPLGFVGSTKTLFLSGFNCCPSHFF